MRLDPARDRFFVAHRVGGALVGPKLFVCGRDSLRRPIFDEILNLPSLPLLTGALLFGYVAASRDDGAVPRDYTPLTETQFDDSLFLDFYGDEESGRAIFRTQARSTILRKMTAIGMISGRGVRRGVS